MVVAWKGRASLNNLSGRPAAEQQLSVTTGSQQPGTPDGRLSKIFWIYFTIYVPLVFEPPAGFCSHIYFSLCFSSRLINRYGGQEKAVSVLKQNSENIVPTGISQSALFFTPSLLLNYWRVFPVPALKLFSLDLGHVPRPWSNFILDSDRSCCLFRIVLRGLEAYRNNFELKLRVFFTSSNTDFKAGVLKGPLRLSKKVTRTEKREEKIYFFPPSSLWVFALNVGLNLSR